jgi:transcriptional regulator with XRE-family HTH domain
VFDYNYGMDISIIGKQIAKGRKEKELSQAGLADLLAVTPQAVSKWERAESLPDIFMLAKISDILDIYDVGYFLGKEPPCPCGFCDCEINIKGGKSMDTNCENFTTIEQFVEYWRSCSLKGLQKIAQKYDVAFDEKDTKETLIKKLTDGMNEYCKTQK